MVDKIITQKDVIDKVKERTGFYKCDIKLVMDALDDIIIELMNTATYDEPAEIMLFKGWRLGAKRVPERPYHDPRNRAEIVTPEKLIPYCKLKQSFRQRLNNWEANMVGDDIEEDSVDEG